MSDPGFFNGRHYTTYVEEAKELKKAKRLEELEHLLLELVSATESESQSEGVGVAPWYYEQLALIYRKNKDIIKEHSILERFGSQPHAPGVSPPKLMERLDKIKKMLNPE